MPENPLLPNKKLQQLYATLLRARDSASRSAGLEAILAAVALQVEPGDAVVSSTHADAFAELLGPARRTASAARALNASTSPLAFASGVAAGAQVAGNSRLVTALLDGKAPEANWAALLGQAQDGRLPLIVICPDTLATKPSAPSTKDALTWAALSRASRKFGFPILTVDGADAVAIYRAMQESVLRARHGDGPAFLWCLLPPPAARSRNSDLPPAERLERYLTARRIALPRTLDRPQRVPARAQK